MATIDTISNKDPSVPNRGISTLHIVLLGVVLALAYAPLVVLQFVNLWKTEQYQYFPFVLGAAAYMAWDRWRARYPRQPSAPSAIKYAKILAVVAWFVLVVAGIFLSPWLATISLLFLLASLICLYSSTTVVPGIWWVWCLLWLNVPPPIDFGLYIVQRLQLLSSQLSSSVLDQIGVHHLMEGNVLELPTKQLFVDEACSGIVSVMSIIAIAAIYSVWKKRNILHTFLIVSIGVAWAVGMNTTRICVIGAAQAWWDFDLATGWQHDVLGLALFVFSFVALISTDILLEFVLAEIPDTAFEKHQNWLERTWNACARFGAPELQQPASALTETAPSLLPAIARRTIQVLAIAFVTIAVFQVYVASNAYARLIEPSLRPVVAESLDKTFVPEGLDGWTLTRHFLEERDGRDQFGHYSHMYEYKNPEKSASLTLSIDFSFIGGWHELPACYRSVGWTIIDRTVVNGESGNAEFVECTLSKDGVQGFLGMSNVDSNGAVITPPSEIILWRPWIFTRRRALRYMAKDVFQVQVFVADPAEIDDETKDASRKLLRDTHNRFVEYISTIRKN